MDCTTKTKIICEPKTTRLTTTNYDRPEVTLTDTLQTNEAMQEKLVNYTRVDNIDDVPLNTHVRYVTMKDNKQRFCLGGLLKKKDHSKYVVLSNGTFRWCVQRYHWKSTSDLSDEPDFETVFFKIKSKDEQQKSLINKQQREIEALRKALSRKGVTYKTDDRSLNFGGGSETSSN